MNRRTFIASAGAITTGAVTNISTNSALATNLEVNDNVSVPENITDPEIKLNFDLFNIITSNININETVDITLRAGFTKQNMTSVYNIERNLNESTGVTDLGNETFVISSSSSSGLDLKNKLETKYNTDNLDLYIKLILEHSDVGSVSTEVKHITIDITESIMPSIEPVNYYDMENNTSSELYDNIGSKTGSINGNIVYDSTKILNGSYSLRNTDYNKSNNISIDPLLPTGGKYTINSMVISRNRR